MTANFVDRQQVGKHDGTVDDILGGVKVITLLVRSSASSRCSARLMYNKYIATREEVHFLCVADFQERCTWNVQDMVQSQYRQSRATAQFPCLFFLRLIGKVWVYWFVVLSDDSSQSGHSMGTVHLQTPTEKWRFRSCFEGLVLRPRNESHFSLTTAVQSNSSAGSVLVGLLTPECFCRWLPR